MNKKGFTLIETVITIAILAMLSLLLIPTISNLINTQKDNSIDEIINSIETSALNYAKENKWNLDWITCINEQDEQEISINELVAQNYLSKAPKHPKTNEIIDQTYTVTIIYNCTNKTFDIDSTTLKEKLK